MNNDLKQKTYILENLGCANCAAKMERRIQALPDVDSASITFATKQLRIEAADPEALVDEIQSICRSIEGEVLVVEKDVASRTHAHASSGTADTAKNSFFSGHKTDIITLVIGAVLFAAGVILEHVWGYDMWFAGGGRIVILTFIIFAAAYLLLGHKVLLTAIRNISHGQVFDENFLMSIATLAAFCIGEFAEGAGVMLFYRIGELFEEMAVERSRSQIMEAVDMRPETVALVAEGEHEHHEHHDEHCDCGCEHEHHEEHCGCGHDHHDHDCCDHEHHHGHHEHEHDCHCGCDHEHDHHHDHLVHHHDEHHHDHCHEHHHDEHCDCGCDHEHHEEHCGCGHDHHEHHEHHDCCDHDHHDCCGHDHHHDHDSVRIIPAGDAKPGDILLVRPGDRIPLDGIVVEGESRIDTSPVTGEPVPVSARPGTEVISGCVNEQGVLKIRVTKPLSESMVTRILDSVENAAAGKPKIDKFITKFAKVYTPIVVALAVLTAVIPSIITGDWALWIKTAITFLVISCPCALVISVPLAFFSGIGAASKLGILFKGGLAIEALKNVKGIIMDKTGTITKGIFVVDSISTFNDMNSQEVLSIAAACEAASSHPVAVSILKKFEEACDAEDPALSIKKPSSIEELPGMGIKCSIQPDSSADAATALCGNRKLMDKFDIKLPELPEVSGTEILVALDGVLIGRIMISDQLKGDSVNAISHLKSMGLTPAMLTGDNMQSATAVASSSGISKVRAGLLPEDKVTALKELRDELGSVMFVGDGINDAPVLAGADVGAAMGSGADAAIEAADVVFMNPSLEAIPQSVTIARYTGRIAMQNIVFALAIKLLVILLGLVGFANIWAAVFADTGVAMLCILNSLRILWRKYD